LLPVQTPVAEHLSAWVQALPSLQAVSTGAGGDGGQTPVLSLLVALTWQASVGLAQTTGAPPQVPPVQTSPVVHLTPSSQLVPFGFGVPPPQRPVAGLQVPASVQAPAPVQETGLLPTQVPAVHLSVWVQALPSLQVEPSAATGLVH
jgi:hypothetical protein